MLRDLHNDMLPVRCLSPVAIGTTGTGKTGIPVNIQGYNGVEFLFDYGSVAATNATFTVTLFEGAAATGSFTSVADTDMLPQSGAEAAAGLAAGARTSGVSKNVTTRLGYIGSQQFVQAKVVSTVTAGTPVAITAVLGYPNQAPTAAVANQ